MVDRQLQATTHALPDAQKRELIGIGLSRLNSFPCGFATDVVYDVEFLRSMEREYRTFPVTDKASATRYGIFIKPGADITSTNCRAVITSRDGKTLPIGEWGKVTLRRADQGKFKVLPGW